MAEEKISFQNINSHFFPRLLFTFATRVRHFKTIDIPVVLKHPTPFATIFSAISLIVRRRVWKNQTVVVYLMTVPIKWLVTIRFYCDKILEFCVVTNEFYSKLSVFRSKFAEHPRETENSISAKICYHIKFMDSGRMRNLVSWKRLFVDLENEELEKSNSKNLFFSRLQVENTKWTAPQWSLTLRELLGGMAANFHLVFFSFYALRMVMQL